MPISERRKGLKAGMHCVQKKKQDQAKGPERIGRATSWHSRPEEVAK